MTHAYRRLASTTVQAMREAYESGELLEVIAARFGVARITVAMRATRCDWNGDAAAAARQEARRRGLRPPTRTARPLSSLVRRLFESGAPTAAVLAAAGMKESGLRKRAKREGWDASARTAAIVARRGDPALPRCGVCREPKPLDAFYYRRQAGRPGVHRDSRCKDCSRRRARDRRRARRAVEGDQ